MEQNTSTVANWRRTVSSIGSTLCQPQSTRSAALWWKRWPKTSCSTCSTLGRLREISGRPSTRAREKREFTTDIRWCTLRTQSAPASLARLLQVSLFRASLTSHRSSMKVALRIEILSSSLKPQAILNSPSSMRATSPPSSKKRSQRWFSCLAHPANKSQSPSTRRPSTSRGIRTTCSGSPTGPWKT